MVVPPGDTAHTSPAKTLTLSTTNEAPGVSRIGTLGQGAELGLVRILLVQAQKRRDFGLGWVQDSVFL